MCGAGDLQVIVLQALRAECSRGFQSTPPFTLGIGDRVFPPWLCSRGGHRRVTDSSTEGVGGDGAGQVMADWTGWCVRGVHSLRRFGCFGRVV